jgi:DNA-binding transcriptional MerR regulator
MMYGKHILEQAYSTSEIAEKVGIAEPTVRKYAQALERSGYHFIKDSFGARTYIEKDFLALQELKEVRAKTSMPVENVAAMIAEKYSNENTIQPVSTSDPDTQLTSLIDDIVIERVRDEMAAFKDALLSRLDERDEVIRELTEAINSQKMLAAAAEETADQRIQQAVDDALARHNVRMKDDIERRDQEIMTFMREQLATRANKSFWTRFFGK